MPPPLIRPAQRDEYDEVSRVWMESWVSTGLEQASNFLLAKLRARAPMEIEKGWSLFVAMRESSPRCSRCFLANAISISCSWHPTTRAAISDANCSLHPGAASG